MAPSPTGSVLIVDDDAAVRDVLCRAASDLFDRVTSASDAGEALDALGQSPFDVLVTDLKMPGMGGLALARVARTSHPGMHVVVVTGYVDGEEQAALDALGVELLRKPFGSNEFRGFLDRVRRG
jgi:CheY-like chemotaxis protein